MGVVAISACDPVYLKRLVVLSPVSSDLPNRAPSDSAGWHPLFQQVMQRRQLTRGPVQPGYHECYWRDAINVCFRVGTDSLELRVMAFPISWRTAADSIQRELHDSLSAHYGESRVFTRTR
jgi:hypothetical protein